jgi:hypothetical protein
MRKPRLSLARKQSWLLTAPGLALLMATSAWTAASTPQDSGASSTKAPASGQHRPLYTYTLAQDGTPEAYDEAMAVACLQGIINRESPELYVLSRKNTRPQYWLDILSKEGRWLAGA